MLIVHCYSLSRQSTQDSETGSVTSQGEPIRKSPREVIIPIAVEGGGYVTPSADTLTRMRSVYVLKLIVFSVLKTIL